MATLTGAGPWQASGVRLRQAGPGDAARLAAFARAQFVATFGPQNDPRHLAAFLAASYGVPQQTRELADPDWVTLFAETDQALVAYAQVSRGSALPVPADGVHAELRRFYVDRAWHGRGLAAVLMDAVIERAAGWGADALVLGVWEENPRGIAFYRRCGFEPIGTTCFMLGGDPQTDLVFRRPLR